METRCKPASAVMAPARVDGTMTCKHGHADPTAVARGERLMVLSSRAAKGLLATHRLVSSTEVMSCRTSSQHASSGQSSLIPDESCPCVC